MCEKSGPHPWSQGKTVPSLYLSILHHPPRWQTWSKTRRLHGDFTLFRPAANTCRALLAEEETVFASIPKKKTVKKKGKDDFDMLNAALSSQPKSKAQKEKEAKAKALEEKKKQEKAKEDARASLA